MFCKDGEISTPGCWGNGPGWSVVRSYYDMTFSGGGVQRVRINGRQEGIACQRLSNETAPVAFIARELIKFPRSASSLASELDRRPVIGQLEPPVSRY